MSCKNHDSMPDVCMVTKKVCYVCILQKWPPITGKQIKRYKKAVSIRLALNTPLVVTTAPAIVEKVGLNNLDLIQDIIDKKIIPHEPRNTFQRRITEYLEANSD